ncbi:MAG: Type restriction-modification system, specificity subunit [Acidobacteria bacterium]|nr:Type restriction-modification system, specificity subunit [Acidobacteriota bacterium]
MRSSSLDEVAIHIRNGFPVKQSRDAGGLPITRIETIADGSINPFRIGYAGLREDECLNWLLQPGDILFSHINSVSHLGKVAMYKGDPRKLVHGMNLLCIRPDAEAVEPKYLLYALRCEEFTRQLSKNIKPAVNQASIAISDLKRLHVPLPPLAEQRRVAAILDKADALRAKRRAALAQLDTLAQSIFLDMFGGPAVSSRRWPVSSLAKLGVEFRYGTSNRSSKHGDWTLRIPNVLRGSIRLDDLQRVPVAQQEFERLRLRDGDLLFVRTNGNPDYVGRCAVYDARAVENAGLDRERFIYASYLIRGRLPFERVSSVFLREFLATPEARRQLRARSRTSAGQYNLNTQGLGAMQVFVPPIDLQREFAHRVAAISTLRERAENALGETSSLFASLQHRAFRGEL